jgi:hypothetical protein
MHTPTAALLPLILLVCATVSVAGEAQSGPEVQPPQPARPPAAARPAMPPHRPGGSFEVETLTVRGSDAASMSAWAELAAQGFHVVAAVPQSDGAVMLLCERIATSRSEPPRLPRAVEQDARAAELLRARLQAMRAVPTPAPAAVPATSTTPVAPAGVPPPAKP